MGALTNFNTIIIFYIVGFTLSSFRIVGEMDSCLRGNDTGDDAHMRCHSSESGNPFCLIYRNMTK